MEGVWRLLTGVDVRQDVRRQASTFYTMIEIENGAYLILATKKEAEETTAGTTSWPEAIDRCHSNAHYMRPATERSVGQRPSHLPGIIQASAASRFS